MGKINVWKAIIAAVVIVIIAQIIHGIGAQVGMGYYLDPAYFSVWSKIMMPEAGPPPASFYYLSILFGFITYLLFAGIYPLLKGSIAGDGAIQKGLIYGIIVFLLGPVAGYLSLYLLINLPLGLILIWGVESFIIYLLAGAIVAWINK
ncbi:MAG: hypothetical protein NT030_01880 [Candidatus Saganbacteria bacterium]|nr:hypothetical protein [Candidatus Saganbacteria bacterium]